jgi:hypothetical protein
LAPAGCVLEKGTIASSGSIAELGRDGHVEQYISA